MSQKRPVRAIPPTRTCTVADKPRLSRRPDLMVLCSESVHSRRQSSAISLNAADMRPSPMRASDAAVTKD
eukprot:4456348-Pleurochrysis_carterae.AAC.1